MSNKIQAIYNSIDDLTLQKAVQEIKKCEEVGYYEEDSLINFYAREAQKITGSFDTFFAMTAILREAAFRFEKRLESFKEYAMLYVAREEYNVNIGIVPLWINHTSIESRYKNKPDRFYVHNYNDPHLNEDSTPLFNTYEDALEFASDFIKWVKK
jgi:hypothetical protein